MNSASKSQAEVFRVDFLRPPFVAMAVAVASYMFYVSASADRPLAMALLLQRQTGLPWALPLYARGPRPIEDSLATFVSTDCPARDQLTSGLRAHKAGSHVA